MEIQTGTPPEPGRYVVWTPCKALQVREWCEPSIASFHDGRWNPTWRSGLFKNIDKIANARKAVETKDRLYGRNQWHSAQIAGIAYSKKGGTAA